MAVDVVMGVAALSALAGVLDVDDQVPYPGTLHQAMVVAQRAGLHRVYVAQHLSDEDKLTNVTSEGPHEVTFEYGEFLLRESTESFDVDMKQVRATQKVRIRRDGERAPQVFNWYTFRDGVGSRNVLMGKIGEMWIELLPTGGDERWGAESSAHVMQTLLPVTFRGPVTQST